MMQSTSDNLSQTIINEAISFARSEGIPDWKERIFKMHRRVEQLGEQIQAKPSVPPELQDIYREEIDSLTLENMQLANKLDLTTQALERAKEAYRTELHHARSLKEKLNELEHRLINALKTDSN